MSVKIMGAVWDAELPPAEKLVLLAFADHADHEGRNVYPGDLLVAWKTGYCERQVIRIRLELIKRRVMIRDGRSPFKTTKYRIDVDALPGREPYETKNNRGRPEKTGDKMSPNYAKISDSESPNLEKQVTFDAKTHDSESLKPSIEPSFLKPKDSIFEPLEGAHYTPAAAWLMVLDQLHAEMPKAAFEQYVTGARLVDFYSNRAVIAVASQYAADWLTSRLASTAARLLTGILNRSVTVEFQLAMFGA